MDASNVWNPEASTLRSGSPGLLLPKPSEFALSGPTALDARPLVRTTPSFNPSIVPFPSNVPAACAAPTYVMFEAVTHDPKSTFST